MIAGAPLHRLTLHFADAALERRYRDAEDGHTMRYGRLGSIGGMVLTVLTTLLLHLFVPQHMLGTDQVLYGGLFVWGFFALMYAASYAPVTVRHPQAAGVAANLVFASALLAVMSRMPAEFLQHRGFMLLLNQLFALYGLLRLRIVPATIAGTSCVLLYALVVGLAGWMPAIDLLRHLFWLTMINVWGVFICYQMDLANRREFIAREAMQREHARAEGLLLNILPGAIAQRLKASTERIAEHAEPVTVLFADIVGFTPLSARKTPAQLVDLLDRVFTDFDSLAAQHGLEKIKTIGDAYMAVAGLPESQPDHALRAARMALAMIERVARAADETGEALQVRIGLHSGPVVAGVIGRSKFSYDLWGDTVNTASRMESSGVAGAVHCSQATASCLDGEFSLHPRGPVEVKGKGTMETFLVLSA
ncbi:adenylate/guanylate cyclase domain-containing protein [Ramlibacter albus]|uniref:Guanylate cyclase domain-containing protein n=1 Tax=Ramlibacter albus TaxID=2079448 RepID=A0A923M5M0_9BURK|nr:adenylate/guanylate cyclase domain-containing protein [Ramlibacter albus]MBC5763348.1 hypothetical protein [Ramlibacter albus]